MEKICVAGLGYIGLPTSIFFADKGYDVHGYDINERVVKSLQNKQIHIDEPGLVEKFLQSVERGNLTFDHKPAEADVFMVAVPTPINENRKGNLSYVESALKSILPYVKKGNLIIIESTIPPKTIEEFVVPIIKEQGFNPDENEVFVAYCPERVIPGKILDELQNNDRIAGGYTEEAAGKAAALFSKNISGNVYETTALTAEMTKLMENTYRDVNIALANELALVSEQLGVDAFEIISLANKHPRVHIHSPGPGVGGHCIPIDPYFIIEKAEAHTPLIQRAREINEQMPHYVVDKINELKETHEIKNIALLGLSYKANVSDVRESPSLIIAEQLIAAGYNVKSHDPYVSEQEVSVSLYSLEESLREADLALILVDHNDFINLPASAFNEMNQKLIFDTKKCIKPMEEITLYQLGNK